MSFEFRYGIILLFGLLISCANAGLVLLLFRSVLLKFTGLAQIYLGYPVVNYVSHLVTMGLRIVNWDKNGC